ncbi:MAG: hypothetical protein HRT67_13440 [Flavobacteriaceae bacterium]|nr:hypothetical protein [Flavobacteriaceae bacterium]
MPVCPRLNREEDIAFKVLINSLKLLGSDFRFQIDFIGKQYDYPTELVEIFGHAYNMFKQIENKFESIDFKNYMLILNNIFDEIVINDFMDKENFKSNFLWKNSRFLAKKALETINIEMDSNLDFLKK